MSSIRDTILAAVEKRYLQAYSYGPQHVYEIGTTEQMTNHVKGRIKELFNHRYDSLMLPSHSNSDSVVNNMCMLQHWIYVSRNNIIGENTTDSEDVPAMISDTVIYDEYKLPSENKDDLYKGMGIFGVPDEDKWNKVIDDNIKMITDMYSMELFQTENDEENDEISELMSTLIPNVCPQYSYVYHPREWELKSEHYKVTIENHKKHNSEINEQILFHGTSGKNIESILENDLLLNIDHAHGVVYGKGIYFTNKFNMGLKYSYNNRDNKKYVLICKVLVGKIERGNSTMLHPTKGYNTTVNDCNNPTIFVKYNNTEYDILGYVELSKNNGPQKALATTTPNNLVSQSTTFKIGDLVGCKKYVDVGDYPGRAQNIYKIGYLIPHDIVGRNGIYYLNRQLKSGVWSSQGCKYLKYEASDLYRVDSNGKPIITNSTNGEKSVIFINKTISTGSRTVRGPPVRQKPQAKKRQPKGGHNRAHMHDRLQLRQVQDEIEALRSAIGGNILEF